MIALLVAAATATATPLFDGVEHRRIEQTVDGKPMVVQIVSLDLTRGVRLAMTPADRSKGMEHVARTVSDELVRRRAQVAVNASYFLPFAGGSPAGDDFYPYAGEPVSVSGATIAEGRQVSPVEIDQDLRVTSIFCILRARVVIRDGQRCPAGTRDAIAAGPRLLTDGEATPLHRTQRGSGRGPRTAVGIAADGKRAWIVVVDGRQDGYSMGASNAELVALFRDLGAHNAMSFDGGGSTALAMADGAGAKLLNRPIHTGVPGRERPVANHLVVFAKAVPE